MLLVPPPMFRSGTPALALTYIGRASDSATNGNSTVTRSFDFGVASPNRHALVIASMSYFNTDPITTCTILGVSATLIKHNLANAEKQAAFLATIPSGGVGNVVVSTSAAASLGGWAIDCYRIDKGTLPVMVDSEGVTNHTTQNLTNSGIVVPADGGIVVASRSGYWGGARTFTWSGLTENSDAARATSYGATTASEKFTGGQNPLNIGVNCSGTISGGSAAFIAVCLQ
jgi:hypothetical protein